MGTLINPEDFKNWIWDIKLKSHLLLSNPFIKLPGPKQARRKVRVFYIAFP